MAAGKHNLLIEQGTTFEHAFLLKQNDLPLVLTGYGANMQIRTSLESAVAVVSLTLGNGISFVPLEGRIDILISATTTAAMHFFSAVYDLELITPAGKTIRLIEGSVKLSKEVTR